MTGIVVVFVFQAEDGIRDADVTGVQTCALPIFDAGLEQPGREQVHPGGGVRVPERRSEERRVGKECRSRWSPYHSKKKRRVRGQSGRVWLTSKTDEAVTLPYDAP